MEKNKSNHIELIGTELSPAEMNRLEGMIESLKDRVPLDAKLTFSVAAIEANTDENINIANTKESHYHGSLKIESLRMSIAHEADGPGVLELFEALRTATSREVAEWKKNRFSNFQDEAINPN